MSTGWPRTTAWSEPEPTRLSIFTSAMSLSGKSRRTTTVPSSDARLSMRPAATMSHSSPKRLSGPMSARTATVGSTLGVSSASFAWKGAGSSCRMSIVRPCVAGVGGNHRFYAAGIGKSTGKPRMSAASAPGVLLARIWDPSWRGRRGVQALARTEVRREADPALPARADTSPGSSMAMEHPRQLRGRWRRCAGRLRARGSGVRRPCRRQ